MTKRLMMAAAAVAAAFGAWADTETVGGITWTYRVVDDEAEIYNDGSSAIPASTSGAITIPATLGGKPVTSIGERAFLLCNCLASVTIPDGVTSIGEAAFDCCSGLMSFAVDEGNAKYKAVNGLLLSKDGTTLVAGVNGDVTIPDGVTSIGEYAFSGCSDLASVTIPDGVTSIGEYAFASCYGLASVTIPDGVTSIGKYAFVDCHDLAGVTIPDSVTSIANFAFASCSGLMSFAVDEGNAKYKSVNGLLLSKDGETLVAGVNGNVTIPDGVTSIGEAAFEGCSGLASVTIPNSVTSIANFAFTWCSGLASVTIPNSVTGIGDAAFSGCDSLATVHVEPGDAERVKALLEASGIDVSQLTFEEEKTIHKLTLKPNSTKYGTATGGGTYVVGAKATLKAKAKSGYVFAGWFKDKSCKKALNPKGYDNRNPTVKYAMPAKNTTVYAKFVTKSSDKKALKFSSATKKLANLFATAGKSFSLALGISSASLPTVTAKGLPKGLEIDKTTGEITGVGTVPGAYTAKVTITSAAGNKITQNVKFTVSVPSWAKGTFYGTAKPDGKALSYLKFTVGSTGKVSGKVTCKGKAYPFTAKYKSCTASKAAFSPAIKVGSKTFKPGTVTVKARELSGLSLVEAANSKGTFAAQKKPNLVKKGKALAELVGKTFTFTKEDADSGLTKTRDKLTVKLADGDAVTVSGTVGGKELTAISWVTLVSDVTAASGATAYTLYVDMIDAKLKYEKTLTIVATAGSGGTEAEAFFGETPPPRPEGQQLWEGGPYWADKNIGADSPEDFGLYFWWGDTTGRRPTGTTFDFDFSGDNPAIYTCGKRESELQGAGWITSDGVLAPEHDAAHVQWGGDWRMPTRQERDDLVSKCDWTLTTQNGVDGYVVRGRDAYASNSIFLPCVGWGYKTSLFDAGSGGGYWSSVPHSEYSNSAWYLYFNSSDHLADYRYRYYGLPVRPVQGAAK